MLDNEDLKWIAATSTELNSMLQQISRYSDLARQHKGEHQYVEMLGDRVELASRTAQALFDRVTSKILAGSTAKAGSDRAKTVPFRVMPSPGQTSDKMPAEKAGNSGKSSGSSTGPTVLPPHTGEPDVEILNRTGSRDLILLIEDEADVADFAAQMLVGEGYRVIVARDGFEALRIYQQIGKQIGLVVLDFFLPVIDGDAVFDELRTINPDVNVVLSSGFAEQGKLSAMLAQGLRGFIPKPYTREKLLEQVRSTLEASRSGTR